MFYHPCHAVRSIEIVNIYFTLKTINEKCILYGNVYELHDSFGFGSTESKAIILCNFC